MAQSRAVHRAAPPGSPEPSPAKRSGRRRADVERVLPHRLRAAPGSAFFVFSPAREARNICRFEPSACDNISPFKNSKTPVMDPKDQAADPQRSGAIVAAVPGRLRLRDPLLARPPQAEAIAAKLRAIDGVRSAEPRPAASSLVLYFDTARHSVPAMVDAVLAAVPEFAAVPDPETDTPEVRPAVSSARRRSRQLNRVAKLGMLASLPASLALAAGGSKRLHIVTGGVFTLLLLAHLLVHRRHLTQ